MIPISLSTTPQFYGHIIWEEISKMWIVNVPTSIFFRATWSNKWRFVSLRHHQPLTQLHTDQKTMKYGDTYTLNCYFNWFALKYTHYRWACPFIRQMRVHNLHRILIELRKIIVDITQQCFAFTPQANFSAHNLNFQWRWRWWDQIWTTV